MLLDHVSSTMQLGDVRLVVPSLHEGRVDGFSGGFWIPFCSKDWDDRDASVVCRQLGMT